MTREMVRRSWVDADAAWIAMQRDRELGNEFEIAGRTWDSALRRSDADPDFLEEPAGGKRATRPDEDETAR